MGFKLRCIKCGHEDAISLDMDDLKTLRCRECDDEFTTEEVAEVIGEWQKALDWINVGTDVKAVRLEAAS